MKLNQKGQSLVELIIALGVVMVVMIGFTNITLTALRNALHAKHQNQATRIAQETLEVIRVIRDLNYYVNVSGTPSVNSDTWSSNVWNMNDENTVRCTNVGGSFPSSSNPTGYWLETFQLNTYSPLQNSCKTNYSSYAPRSFTPPNQDGTTYKIYTQIRPNITNTGSTIEVEIKVFVEWDDSKGTNVVEASTILSRWE